MAVSFSTRKCDSCAGSLEYIRARKVWKCKYCGQEVVREEAHDISFSIKNVARQTIADVAYRRIDQAERNLTECEKMDSRYIGTVIARICYRMITLITGTCRNEEMKGIYQRVKDDYLYLKEKENGISEEEESFYEFLASGDSSADAIATLIVLFNTLNDPVRPEYLFNLLEIDKVYSKECNKDLLAYTLNSNRIDAARSIIANRNNLDLHSALDVVLARCPDGSEKADMAVSLLESGAYTGQDRDRLQNYIMDSDSCGTKARILNACKNNGALPSMDTIIEYVLSGSTTEELATALEGICTGHIPDTELYTLIEYAFKAETPKAVAILETVASSGQFTALNAKQLGMIFFNTDRSADDRILLWNKIQDFHIDAKAIVLVVSDYLCSIKEDPDSRKKLLNVLLTGITSVSPSVLDRYLLSCTADGERKPLILQKLLGLEEMRPAYFNDALGKYIKNAPDPINIKKAVVDVLVDSGLTLDPNSINDFICSPNTSAQEKIEILRKLENNNCQMRADSLSVYLEQCPNRYEEGLFIYLFSKSTTVSEAAIRNFVLVCNSDQATKAYKAASLAAKQPAPFGSAPCQVNHLYHRITCNLAQAYLLTTPDCYETASSLLAAMSERSKLTADIQVDGVPAKFKKYIKDNRSELSPMTEQLCRDYKLFSLF